MQDPTTDAVGECVLPLFGDGNRRLTEDHFRDMPIIRWLNYQTRARATYLSSESGLLVSSSAPKQPDSTMLMMNGNEP
jgi:hypothetical protein